MMDDMKASQNRFSISSALPCKEYPFQRVEPSIRWLAPKSNPSGQRRIISQSTKPDTTPCAVTRSLVGLRIPISYRKREIIKRSRLHAIQYGGEISLEWQQQGVLVLGCLFQLLDNAGYPSLVSPAALVLRTVLFFFFPSRKPQSLGNGSKGSK